MFLSKYSLDRNNTIASLFRTQYTPDFLIAEYHSLRNTIFLMTKDLALGWDYVGTRAKVRWICMLPFILKKSRKIAKQVSDINITTIFFLIVDAEFYVDFKNINLP
jgi:hypothetical protein